MAGPRVGLFVTCLVDLIRPSVGFAAVKLLEDAGCVVDVPAQTCCGQPAFNSGRPRRHPRNRRTGDRGVRALRLRRGAVRFLRRDAEGALPRAVRGRSELAAARRGVLPPRCYELVSFLVDVMGVTAESARAFDGTVTYHDSCSGLRELGVKAQPRTLLASVHGLDARRDARTPMSAAASAARSASNIREISNAIVDEEGRAYRGDRRRHAAGGRSRLPDEHGRQALPRWQQTSRCATSPKCWPA